MTKHACKCLFLLVSIFIALSAPTMFPHSLAHAHTIGQSYIFLRVYDNDLNGTFEITLRDLNRALDLNEAADQITQANLHARMGEAQQYYSEKVLFFNGKTQLPLRFTEVKTRKLKIGTYVLLDFSIIDSEATPDAIDIDYKVLFEKDPNHLGLLVIEHFWNANLFDNERRVSLIFSPSEHRQRLSFAEFSRFQGFLGIVKMGVKHIWKGIDHLLFLLALILPAAMRRRDKIWEPLGEFRPAIFYTIKIVTLFTIAHSITLSIAAIGVFNLPSRLVESIIAFSIIVTALDIIIPIFHRKIGWVVFVFGLFHGFGFASVLAELGVLGDHMVLSLFGFNLGVEIGQIVVVSFIFPVIYIASRYAFYPKIIMRYGAVAMVLIAAFWFVERAFAETGLAALLIR